jgi:type I restriction enzyme S subunit
MPRIFPEGWREVRLEDVCEYITVGHVGPMANEYVPDGIPFLRSQNILPYRVNCFDVKYISPEFHSKLKKSALRPRDVAVVRTGYPGTAAVIPLNLPVSNCADLVIIRPSNNIDPRFLASIFNSVWGRGAVAGNLVGVAQQHFNVGAAKNLRIVLPHIDVQVRIASILSTYDDLIENNTRRIAVLEEMVRRLYEEWFLHFQSPDVANAKRDKSEFGEIPSGWACMPLSDLCSRITDGSHRSPTTIEDGRTMCSVKDMREWGFDLSSCKRISDSEYDELVRNNCQPIPGDILIAKDGANLNKHTFLVTEPLDVVLLSSIAIIRPGVKVEREFLVAQLKSADVSRRIKESATGAAIPRIILKDFKRLPIIVPPKEVQQRWCDLVGPMHTLCRTLIKKNTNLRAQRDLLLPKLISGEIDVSAVPLPEELAAE